MGLTDLELYKKLRGTSRWEKVRLPDNLPLVDLSDRPVPQVSSSPPPGRPGHGTVGEKRGRESSGSETEQENPKAMKQTDDSVDVIEVEKQPGTEKEDPWTKSINAAELVSDGCSSSDDGQGAAHSLDPGNFTSVQGTPVKSTFTPKHVQSPILSRSGKKSLK